MMRSFELAAESALHDESIVREADRAAAMPWARLWMEWLPAAFLGEWMAVSRGSTFLPTDRSELALLLDQQRLDELLEAIARDLEGRGAGAQAELALRDLVAELGLG
jgi:hypothetical protein